MAVGKRPGASLSFGVGWLQDQLRSRFDIRGPIGEPTDVAPLVQVGMEARPSLPWEFGNARWFPSAARHVVNAGGAGTFANLDISVVAASQRALIVEQIAVFTAAAASEMRLHVNQAFVAPTVGPGLLDGRFLSAGSWTTPVTDWGLGGSNVAAAPDNIANAVEELLTQVGPRLVCLSTPIIVMPGQRIALWDHTGNVQIRATVRGLLVPLGDLS